jgi:hypothetical protein
MCGHTSLHSATACTIASHNSIAKRIWCWCGLQVNPSRRVQDRLFKDKNYDVYTTDFGHPSSSTARVLDGTATVNSAYDPVCFEGLVT